MRKQFTEYVILLMDEYGDIHDRYEFDREKQMRESIKQVTEQSDYPEYALEKAVTIYRSDGEMLSQVVLELKK